jgi:RNA polymerase sigma-70 factor (ECF subfamily)
VGTASQRRLPEFQGRSSFGTWTYRIVTNRCLNVTEARDAVRELRRALDVLSPGQRACWVLREPDGRSYEFVAKAVGISQEAVRARVFRARRCLTQALGAWR